VHSRTWTNEAAFGAGSSVKVPDGPNRPQLNDRANALGLIWVAVSSKRTIVKLDTATDEVLGEYRTAPEGQPTNPSRTTVELNGNIRTANRDGNSVVHVGLVENGQCVDRSRDGQIQTSTGLGDVHLWVDTDRADTDGGVSIASDEFVLHYTKVSAAGHDRLKGQDGDDRLDRGRQIDRCSGGRGSNLLIGCEHRHAGAHAHS
jgi:hypothetical protein